MPKALVPVEEAMDKMLWPWSAAMDKGASSSALNRRRARVCAPSREKEVIGDGFPFVLVLELRPLVVL
ncbi:hypothetical protein ZWY2020_009923 [Hordeum vulgare]|nr:hypothetical protein ZWY2020_009923 [Hordeum vulgare]